MIALVLATTLQFTMPTTGHLRDVTQCDRGDSIPLSSVSVRLYEIRQSQTWIDSSAVITSSNARFTRLWPLVRAEASPVITRSKLSSVGAHDSLAVPLGPWLSCWLVAATFGGESCPTFQVPLAGAGVLADVTTSTKSLAGEASPGDTVSVSLFDRTQGLEIWTSPATSYRVDVYDVAGRRLAHSSFSRGRVVVDVEAWPQGIYFVRVGLADRVVRRRVVVLR